MSGVTCKHSLKRFGFPLTGVDGRPRYEILWCRKCGTVVRHKRLRPQETRGKIHLRQLVFPQCQGYVPQS